MKMLVFHDIIIYRIFPEHSFHPEQFAFQFKVFTAEVQMKKHKN